MGIKAANGISLLSFPLIFLAACEPAYDTTSPFAPPSRGAPLEDGLTIGGRLMNAGEYELALKEFRRAGREEGLTAEVFTALGSANLGLGRLGQAKDLLKHAIEADANYVPAWNNAGVVAYELGDFPSAERAFRRAFALDSGQSVEIRDNLAKTLAKIENPSYEEPKKGPQLLRRAKGDYLLVSSS